MCSSGVPSGLPLGTDHSRTVWSLLALAYERHGVHPTLLERDFNFPPLAELATEVQRIRGLQAAHAGMATRRAHG